MSKEREILRRSPQIFENNPVLMAITSMPEIIFAEVNDASPYNGTRIRFTFSAGVADSREFDRVALTIGDIIEKADNRLYQAKKTGKNKVVFCERE